MKLNEMLEIVNNCVVCDEGFMNPETGEVFTEQELMDIEGELDEAIDRIGMNVIEAQFRLASKKSLVNHYRDEAKIEENRIERLQYFLGYLTQGRKKKCEHVTISFLGKQERLAYSCAESLIPQEFKKERISYVPDTERIRKGIEAGDPAVKVFAYIDTRKKASVR